MRLLVMCHLANSGEMSVGAIAEKVMLSQSALSQHLAKLRALDLVETFFAAGMMQKVLNDEAARELLELNYVLGERSIFQM